MRYATRLVLLRRCQNNRFSDAVAPDYRNYSMMGRHWSTDRLPSTMFQNPFWNWSSIFLEFVSNSLYFALFNFFFQLKLDYVSNIPCTCFRLQSINSSIFFFETKIKSTLIFPQLTSRFEFMLTKLFREKKTLKKQFEILKNWVKFPQNSGEFSKVFRWLLKLLSLHTLFCLCVCALWFVNYSEAIQLLLLLLRLSVCRNKVAS